MKKETFSLLKAVRAIAKKQYSYDTYMHQRNFETKAIA